MWKTVAALEAASGRYGERLFQAGLTQIKIADLVLMWTSLPVRVSRLT